MTTSGLVRISLKEEPGTRIRAQELCLRGDHRRRREEVRRWNQGWKRIGIRVCSRSLLSIMGLSYSRIDPVTKLIKFLIHFKWHLKYSIYSELFLIIYLTE